MSVLAPFTSILRVFPVHIGAATQWWMLLGICQRNVCALEKARSWSSCGGRGLQVRASPVKCELRVMTQEMSFPTTGVYVASKHQQSQRRKTTLCAENRGLPNRTVGTRFESGVH